MRRSGRRKDEGGLARLGARGVGLRPWAALGAQGYSSYIGTARRGECLRVARTHEASAAALEREVATMCRIADAHRIAYRHWQAEVGGKSVRIRDGRLTVDGKAS